MDRWHRESAASLRASLVRSPVTPAQVRAALASVPALDRDAWVDLVLGIEGVPEDGPELPRGCVPYLPCPVEALLRVMAEAEIGASDVFVDIGCGIGRAALLVHLLTGASAVGVEIQRPLAAAARTLAAHLNASRFSVIDGDAAQLVGSVRSGSVFLLYCPFGGERLEEALDRLEPIARMRQIRVCSVDLTLPPRPWLTLASPAPGAVSVYRSAAGARNSGRLVPSGEPGSRS